MLWRPPEQRVRALALVQMAGQSASSGPRRRGRHWEAFTRVARVDHAADGDVEKMLEELRRYADPASRSETGRSALEAAAAAGQIEAVNTLLDFEARPEDEPGLMQAALECKVPELTSRMLKLLHSKDVSLDVSEGKPSLLQSTVTADSSLEVLDTDRAEAPLDTSENEPPLLQLAVNADRRDAFDALMRASRQRVVWWHTHHPCGVDGQSKWLASAVGASLCAPCNASSILVIDSETAAVHTIAWRGRPYKGWHLGSGHQAPRA